MTWLRRQKTPTLSSRMPCEFHGTQTTFGMPGQRVEFNWSLNWSIKTAAWVEPNTGNIVWEVISISRNICTFYVFEFIWDQLRNSCPIIFLILVFEFSLNWTCTHHSHNVELWKIYLNWEQTKQHTDIRNHLNISALHQFVSVIVYVHKSIDNDLTRSLWLLRARGSRFIRFDLCLSNNGCMKNLMILTVKRTADDHNSHVNLKLAWQFRIYISAACALDVIVSSPS